MDFYTDLNIEQDIDLDTESNLDSDVDYGTSSNNDISNSKDIRTAPVNFLQNKSKLKDFSETIPENTQLPTVEEDGGLFGWFDHDVTGAELNSVTDKIQNIMIVQNQSIIKIIREFNTIYDTFTSLDSEYIKGILISLKTTEKTMDDLRDSQSDIKNNQDDIDEIINKQKQFLQVLKKFKEKIDKIEHLKDIDKLFASYPKLQSEYQSFKSELANKNCEIDQLNQRVESLSKELKMSKIIAFASIGISCVIAIITIAK
jgi:hypothetical protein